MGDYDNNINNIIPIINEGLYATVTSDYSINGDYSLKIESSLNQYQGLAFNLSNIPTGRIKISLSFIKVLNSGIEFRLTENGQNTTITVPQNNNPQVATIEKEVLTNSMTLTLIFRSSNIIVYADNLICKR